MSSNTYTIKSGNTSYEIRVSNGICIAASPFFDWAVTLSWDYVRRYCLKKGWRVSLVDDPDEGITTFNLQGCQYCFYTDGKNVSRITRDDEDISWRDVPDVLKGLL